MSKIELHDVRWKYLPEKIHQSSNTLAVLRSYYNLALHLTKLFNSLFPVVPNGFTHLAFVGVTELNKLP